jgi:hypothetical protein
VNIIFDYKLPKRKKNLITKEFLQTFKQELDDVFNDKPKVKQCNYWNFYTHIENTSGFYKALLNTCEKHNLTKAIYIYACKLHWYDSDMFDSELVLLMVKYGVIEEGNISELYYDYENDKDYELIITEKKLKDCTVIYKDWFLTKECKERMGFVD